VFEIMALVALITDESGASLVEYGLLAALIALVAFVSVKALGTHLSSLYSTEASSI
jgi:pilus assembly protein Flp/PilA